MCGSLGSKIGKVTELRPLCRYVYILYRQGTFSFPEIQNINPDNALFWTAVGLTKLVKDIYKLKSFKNAFLPPDLF
jgi:hypothetical protein